MHNRPEAVPRRPALVTDVVAGGFGCAVNVGSRSRSDSCVSSVVLTQGIDDRNVQANRLRAYRSGSIGQDLSESQGRDAQDVRRPWSTIAREDVQENVRGLTDWPQTRPFAEIEVDVSDRIVQRSSVSPRHTR